MAAKPLVDFMIAGVQKAGTTALFDYLAEHPGVRRSDVKEVHFFDDEAIDWAAPDYERYHRHFPPADGRPCGEATPIYTYWPRSLERIRAYNPDAKLVVMLRDPVNRAWSHWRMEYARGVETRPFAWCIREGRQRLFEAEPWGHHREFSYVERGFYGEQVERLRDLFPPEQVLVMRAEDLRTDPTAALARLSGFLGVAAPHAVGPRESHVGREMDYGTKLSAEDVAHLRETYARDDERLAALTGLRYG